MSWESWPNPPRLPLGDPHHGSCSAAPVTAEDDRLRTCCNNGYARGVCPHFPAGDAPDAVRFGIVQLQTGLATIRYVVERDHHPYDHGTLHVPDAGRVQDGATVLERQARAFLASYVRRKS